MCDWFLFTERVLKTFDSEVLKCLEESRRLLKALEKIFPGLQRATGELQRVVRFSLKGTLRAWVMLSRTFWCVQLLSIRLHPNWKKHPAADEHSPNTVNSCIPALCATHCLLHTVWHWIALHVNLLYKRVFSSLQIANSCTQRLLVVCRLPMFNPIRTLMSLT